MNKVIRELFKLFIGLSIFSFIAAPVLVLYNNGYVFNMQNFMYTVLGVLILMFAYLLGHEILPAKGNNNEII